MFFADGNCQQMHGRGQECSQWHHQQFSPAVSGTGLLKMETLLQVSSASSVIKQWLERAQHWFDYWFNVFRRGSLLARELLAESREQQGQAKLPRNRPKGETLIDLH